MIKTICTALALSTVLVVGALCAHKAHAQTMHENYREAIKVCGAEWKASDARKSVEKGKGREAWNEFRVECIKRNPYQTKRTRSATKATD